MAKFVLKNAHVSIGGTDLSDHAESIEFGQEVALQEATAMSDAALARLAGLQDASVTINFRQDFGSSSVDSTLNGSLGSAVAVALRPDAGAIAATNPEYQFNALVESYNPITGGVGDTAMCSVTLRLSDGAAPVRDTTP